MDIPRLFRIQNSGLKQQILLYVVYNFIIRLKFVLELNTDRVKIARLLREIIFSLVITRI